MYFLLEKVDFHCYVRLLEGNINKHAYVTVLDMQRDVHGFHVLWENLGPSSKICRGRFGLADSQPNLSKSRIIANLSTIIIQT